MDSLYNGLKKKQESHHCMLFEEAQMQLQGNFVKEKKFLVFTYEGPILKHTCI